MSTISPSKNIENKHNVHRQKGCMKKVCESVREHTMKKINFKKKKNEVIDKRAAGIIFENKYEKFENKYLRDKKYSKIRNGCHHINEYRGVLQISYVI